MIARRLNVVCLIGWLAVGFGCLRSGDFPPSDTPSANKARVQIGIRPIQTNWIFCGSEFRVERWTDGTDLCKYVQRGKTGTLMWEKDCYSSGVTYTTSNGTQFEGLSVNYDYGTKQVSLDYLSTNAAIAALFQNLTLAPFGPKDPLGGQKKSHVGRNDQETFAVADKVLGIWKRTRL